MPHRRSILKTAVQVGLAAAVVATLWWISTINPLLFHVLVELFSVIVALSLFMVFWNARRSIENGYLTVLGIAMLPVALVDLMHTLTYRGMGEVFGIHGSNTATQLWIVGRYVHAAALLVAPLAIGRRVRSEYVLAPCVVVTTVLLATIFAWPVFPACYVDSAGGADGYQTAFKIGSEYAICTVMAAGLVLMWRRRTDFQPTVFRLLAASVVLMIVAELLFTLYRDVFGMSNILGHFAKLGSFAAIYWAVLDIGVRRPARVLMQDMVRSREALRQSEQRFRTVADFTHDWEYWRGPDGQFLYVSPSCERITGYTSDEFMADTDLFLRITHPDDRERIERHIDALLSADAQHMLEFRIMTRSGDVRWISHVCQDVVDADGQRLGRRSSNRDITARRHAQEQRELVLERLEHEQARLHAIIDGAAAGIVMVDPTGTIRLMNPAARELYEGSIARGYPDADEASPAICMLDGTPYDFERLPLLRAARDGETRTAVELALVWPDGRRRDVLENVAPIRDNQGRLIGAVAIFQDISREHQFKAELVRRAQQLETLIREAHHRIRNNLQSVIALIEVERTHVGPDGQASLDRCGARVRAIATVHRLLTTEATREVRLVDLLKALVELAGAGYLGEDNARVAIGVSGENIRVSSKTATSVAVVVNELIVNAVQHAFAGRDSGHVSISVRHDGKDAPVEITVDDNGRGCPATSTPGTGLRLARAIVENELRGQFDILAIEPGCRCRVRFHVQEDADDHRRD